MNAYKHVRVLLVDDEADYLLSLKLLLESMGATVDTADTAAGAEQLIDEYAYSLAIVDKSLTGGNAREGFEIVRRLKARHPATVAIALTAYGGPGVAQEAREAGADTFCEKPISMELIENVLKSLKD